MKLKHWLNTHKDWVNNSWSRWWFLPMNWVKYDAYFHTLAINQLLWIQEYCNNIPWWLGKRQTQHNKWKNENKRESITKKRNNSILGEISPITNMKIHVVQVIVDYQGPLTCLTKWEYSIQRFTTFITTSHLQIIT